MSVLMRWYRRKNSPRWYLKVAVQEERASKQTQAKKTLKRIKEKEGCGHCTTMILREAHFTMEIRYASL